MQRAKRKGHALRNLVLALYLLRADLHGEASFSHVRPEHLRSKYFGLKQGFGLPDARNLPRAS
jgi:hypothetical protein